MPRIICSALVLATLAACDGRPVPGISHDGAIPADAPPGRWDGPLDTRSRADRSRPWPGDRGPDTARWPDHGVIADKGVGLDLPAPDSYVPPPATCAGTAKVFLEEVSTGQPDYLVLVNKGAAAASIAGFRLEMLGINSVSYVFGAGASIPAGGAVYVFEYSSGTQTGDINTGANIPFYDEISSNSVALYDAGGDLLDFATIGDMAVGVPPGVTAGLVAWPVGHDSSKSSFQRAAYTGACPAFKASDWTTKAMTRP